MQSDRKPGIYERFIKRVLDVVCVLFALILFFWLFILIGILVRIKLGSPVIFKQPRPGQIDPKTGRERIFRLYKFRTMTDEKDENGALKPDHARLTKFGKLLRATSLDELPEVWNILRGEMSLVGPRPQLVRDMVFMTDRQRERHLVKPGLTGLAQVKGRNMITWDEKFELDLEYIKKVTFIEDLKILFGTVAAVFTQSGITDGENATALDFGDVLLRDGKVDREKYESLNKYAEELLAERFAGKK